jgi:hypothetical protein
MLIEKGLCNKILIALLANYPGFMSSKSFESTIPHESYPQRVFAAHYKYLDEKGLIETEISIQENADGTQSHLVVWHQTRITALGIDFIEEGGFTE